MDALCGLSLLSTWSAEQAPREIRCDLEAAGRTAPSRWPCSVTQEPPACLGTPTGTSPGALGKLLYDSGLRVFWAGFLSPGVLVPLGPVRRKSREPVPPLRLCICSSEGHRDTEGAALCGCPPPPLVAAGAAVEDTEGRDTCGPERCLFSDETPFAGGVAPTGSQDGAGPEGGA